MSKKILFFFLFCSVCVLQTSQKNCKNGVNSIAELKQVMQEVKTEKTRVYSRNSNPHIAKSRTKKIDGDPEQRKNIEERK